MAENHIPNLNNQNSDVKDLLELLDRMQNRPRVQEVEDALIEQGRPDLVRTDIFSGPTSQDGFIPTVSNEKLADLLITPTEEPITPSQPTPKEPTEEKKEVALFYGDDEEEEEDWDQLPPPPEQKHNPIKSLLYGAGLLLPRKGDSMLRMLCKGGTWLSLLAMLLVAVLLVGDMKIAPIQQKMLHQELMNLYQDSTDATVTGDNYPFGMLTSFKQLYNRNKDVKGWVSFHAEGKDFLDIEYPFVQSKDGYYQNHDFDGNESDYGTLYTDGRIEGYYAADRVLAIYSNGTPDRSMLSSMNRLVGPVDYARAVPELTLTTLYRRDIYYVFAMTLTDGSGKDPFQPIQTEFASEEAFLQYIQSLCARSLFDYPVDVSYDDSIVLLTVPTGEVSTGLTDGRIVVAARRRRAGEISVQANQIMKNKNAIMPYSWYTSRGKTLHDFFYSGQEPVDTTTVAPTIPTTTMTFPDGTTTTTGEESGGLVGGLQVDKNSTGSTESTTSGATGSVTSTTSATGTGSTTGTKQTAANAAPSQGSTTTSGQTTSSQTEDSTTSSATESKPSGTDTDTTTE